MKRTVTIAGSLILALSAIAAVPSAQEPAKKPQPLAAAPIAKAPAADTTTYDYCAEGQRCYASQR